MTTVPHIKMPILAAEWNGKSQTRVKNHKDMKTGDFASNLKTCTSYIYSKGNTWNGETIIKLLI